MLQLFPSPGRKAIVGGCLTWTGRVTMVSEWVLVQAIVFVLSSPQYGTLSCQPLDPDKTKIRHSKVWTLDVCFSVLFLSLGRSLQAEFLFIMLCWTRSRNYGMWVPTRFDTPVLCLLEVQEVNWFLHFSQRELFCVLLLNLYLCDRKGFLSFQFCHLADINLPESFSHFIHTFFITLIRFHDLS